MNKCSECNLEMKLDNVVQTEKESRTTEFWICDNCKRVDMREIE